MEYILRMRQQGFETIDAIKGRIGGLTKELEKVKIGSARFDELTTEMRTAQGAVDQARQKFDTYATTTERATGFMREQRKEQRLQNFYFRESQQALGAVSLGLAAFNGAAGESSKGMANLSNAVNQGFLAFQGLDFMMSGFKGPAGIAIAAIGGVSAMLFSMHQQAAQAALRVGELDEQIMRLQVELGKASKQEMLSFLQTQLLKAKTRLEELKVITYDWTVLLRAGMGTWLKTSGTLEEIRAAEIKILELEKATQGVNKDITGDKEKQYQANAKSIEKLNEAVELWDKMELSAARMAQVGGMTPKLAGLDTKAFDKALEQIQTKGFKLPEISPLSALGSTNDLQNQLRGVEEELSRLEIGSGSWLAKLGEVDALKAKIEGALITPLQKVQKSWAQAVPFVTKGIGTIAQFSAQKSEEQLNRIESEKTAALARIDAQLANEKLSEAERLALLSRRAQVEAEYDAKTREAKAQAFQADKTAKTIQAVIDTASAVVEALPNIPLSVLVGAMGAAQVALIAGQPTPKFHSGGVVPGGMYLDSAPHQNVPILARGGETIRTEAQEASIGRGGSTLIFNFNGPVSDGEFVWKQITKRLRETGLDITAVAVNNRANLRLAK